MKFTVFSLLFWAEVFGGQGVKSKQLHDATWAGSKSIYSSGLHGPLVEPPRPQARSSVQVATSDGEKEDLVRLYN